MICQRYCDTVKSAKNPKKAEAKLKSEGYTKVHICGENIAAKAEVFLVIRGL